MTSSTLLRDTSHSGAAVRARRHFCTMTVVDLVRLCGRERPRRIGRRRERFPGLDEIDRLAHAREQLRLGVIVLPAAGFVELNEMCTAPLGERTPLLRD